MENTEQPIFKARLLVVIVDSGESDKVVQIVSKFSPGFKSIVRGRGTADSEILDYLGLGESEKEIVLCFIRAQYAHAILKELEQQLELKGHGNGIAFTINITGVGGRKTFNTLSRSDVVSMMEANCTPGTQFEEEEQDVVNEQFDLIMTIVNRGFADDVMDSAKTAGAEGGTVIHARGAGIHETEKFFGVSIQPEKELVLILSPQEKRTAIMAAICEKAGLAQAGKGVSFSLPVDEVSGIVHLLKDEQQ